MARAHDGRSFRSWSTEIVPATVAITSAPHDQPLWAPPKYVVRHSFWEWEQRAPVAESSYLRSSDSRSCRGSSQDLGRTAQATAHPLRPRPHWLVSLCIEATGSCSSA